MAEPFVPETLEELLPAIDNENKRIAAGCTDIMVAVKAGKLEYKPVIDINEIKEIKRIYETETSVYIGSNVPLSSVIENKIVNNNFPLLIEAIKTIGSPQIRNRATLGGNIGNASPSGDGILALTVLDAGVILKSPGGERKVNIKDFITGVGKKDLKNNEFIEYIVIDKKFKDYNSYFEKVGLRNAMVISVASIGILYKTEKNIIKEIKIAYGAAAPKVIEITEAEKYLAGKELIEENLLKAGEIIENTVSPIDDVRASGIYRKTVCKNLILRLIEKSAGKKCGIK